MRWILYTYLSLWLCGGLSAQSGYNAYALNKLSDSETLTLARYLAEHEPGKLYRFGGEEFENETFDNVGKYLNFLTVSKATGVALLAPADYEAKDFSGVYAKFAQTGILSDKVTFLNEQWFEYTDWSYVSRDLFNYVFNKVKYYQNRADDYMKDASDFLVYMSSKGYPVKLVVNVPLAENKFFRAYTDRLKTYPIEYVDIHVYVKPDEVAWTGSKNYWNKLESWLRVIDSYGWEVMAGEVSGFWITHPQLKNSLIQKNNQEKLIQKLTEHGITETYLFTLAENEQMTKWSNEPIFPRFLIRNGECIDQMDNVYK